MIALWMMYATVIAAILGVAAAIVERTGTRALRQRRWIWSVALALSVGIPVAVAFLPDRGASMYASVDAGDASKQGAASLSGGGTALASRIAGLLAATDSRSLARFDTTFAVGWAIAAVLALSAYGVATWSLERRRRSWRSAVVDGQPVLLSSSVGPAVIGAVRPAIVVPEWSLSLSAEQRSLMIEHERQHVRAGDPLMLHAAALVALLMPWNVAVWWLNRRLRLAVELDCDARVLARGGDPSVYGRLLLDVCSRRTRPAAVLAPALLERTSSLTKRILAMHPTPVRFARSRLALGAVAALGIVAIACDMPTPEMLAPNGQNVATKRLYGSAAVMPVDGIEHLRAIVQRYFPSVARGEGGPSVLFVVRSSTGAIVMTEAQPASTLARSRDGSGSERAQARLPGGIGSLQPNDIAAIEVTKHGVGVLAPEAVSVIVISLKPLATIPTSAAQ